MGGPVAHLVSISAMLEAQCYVNKNMMGEHARFVDCLADTSPTRQREDNPPDDHSLARRACIRDLCEFAQSVLWVGKPRISSMCPLAKFSTVPWPGEVVLPQYNVTLCPTHAVRVFKLVRLDEIFAEAEPEAERANHFCEPIHSAEAVQLLDSMQAISPFVQRFMGGCFVHSASKATLTTQNVGKLFVLGLHVSLAVRN